MSFILPSCYARPLSVLASLVSEIRSVRSLTIHLMLKYQCHDQLLDLEIDPSNYNDSVLYARDRLLTTFLKKVQGGEDPSAASTCIESFRSSEEQNLQTNIHLLTRLNSGYNDLFQIAVSKIASVLGSLDNVHISDFGFGPGTSRHLRGNDTSVYRKVSEIKPTVTSSAASLAQLLLQDSLWGQLLERSSSGSISASFRITDSGKLSHVPKNFRTRRSIMIEPLLNTYIQKGIGKAISRRLFSKTGINLRDQSVNRLLAGRAQRCGLATVDFSNASNTISYELVKHLLPVDWFHLLDTIRTPTFEYKGSYAPLNMFSSMGNGFTFELESLIFYALAYASCVKEGASIADLSVFGDDVIIPQSAVDCFRELSLVCGFSFNSKKSFTSGRFFESCGADFFDGVEVRPAYCRSTLNSDFDLTVLHNQLILSSAKVKLDLSKTLRLIRSYTSNNPSKIIVPRPYSGGFWPIDYKEERRVFPRIITNRGWEGVYCYYLSPLVDKRVNTIYEASIIHSLHGFSNGTRTIRGAKGYIVKKAFFPYFPM